MIGQLLNHIKHEDEESTVIAGAGAEAGDGGARSTASVSSDEGTDGGEEGGGVKLPPLPGASVEPLPPV